MLNTVWIRWHSRFYWLSGGTLTPESEKRKYKYIVYSSLSAEGNAAGPDGWKKVFDKEDEIAKKHGVKVLTRGIPYGVNETWVSVYESEKYIDNLMGLHQESGRGKYIDSARTITVVPFPWDRWKQKNFPLFSSSFFFKQLHTRKFVV